MKKEKKLFFCLSVLGALLVITGGMMWDCVRTNDVPEKNEIQTNKYGAFLAMQHAVYVNDFEVALRYSDMAADLDIDVVKNSVAMVRFLSGQKIDSTIEPGENIGASFIYDASLLVRDDWKGVYARHKGDKSPLAAPLSIWSSVATGKTDEALKFLDKQLATDSWKDFVRGQISREAGKIKDAAKYFDKVSPDFMNINDYLYIVDFYKDNEMTDKAEDLRASFTSKPGGMALIGIEDSKFFDYTGYKGALAFGLIQNVSHSTIMAYSDLSLLLLRLAQQLGADSDAMNYYLGCYFVNAGGDWRGAFEAVNKDSVFYPFARLKIAEKTGNIEDVKKLVTEKPLFTPGTTKLVAKYMQNGREKEALKVINNALDDENISGAGRSFFLRERAKVKLMVGDLESAQSDIRGAADAANIDPGILAIQARIWAKDGRELDEAYEYAITLVRKYPLEVEFWDVLGAVVYEKEGAEAALEVLERVGQVSVSYSPLYERLGDIYAEQGDKKRAVANYKRAIKLSEDGFVMVPELEKKIKDLK